MLIPLSGIAADKIEKKHEKTKTIHKNFSVNENATLYLKNKYGNLNVTTWDENKIDITIKITVKGNDIDKIEDKLNSIDVQFEASNSLVEARTIIEKTKSSWSFWGSSNNINYKINYFVKMPKTNNADFNNRYGNIDIDILEGKANIDCDYGKIEIDKLLNSDNIISLDYCSSSEINYMKSGNVSIDYSKLKIKESEKLKVSADYSGVVVGNVSKIRFSSDYGSIKINNADDIIGSSDYAGVKIGTVHKNLKISTDYGGVKVNNLAKGFEKVDINGSYAGIKIGTTENNNFDFVVSLSYAGFKYPDDKVETTKSIKKSTQKYYEGSFGNSNSGSKVHIKSSYGSVSLKVND